MRNDIISRTTYVTVVDAVFLNEETGTSVTLNDLIIARKINTNDAILKELNYNNPTKNMKAVGIINKKYARASLKMDINTFLKHACVSFIDV